MKGIPWTDKDIATAKRVLADFAPNQLEAAAHAVAKAVHRPVNKNSLTVLFQHRGLGTPSAHMLGALDVPEPDPVERHEKQTKVKRLESEHRDLLLRLKEANDRNAFIERIARPALPVVIQRERTSRIREATAFAPASDWHVEEVVLPEQCAGVNAYNLEIAKERAHRYFRGVHGCIEHNRSTFKIRDLVMPFMGDFMSGYIHEELQETNDLSPVQTVLALRGILAGGVRYLLDNAGLERIIIPCDHGNHGRTGGPGSKKKIKTGAINSFEWLLYNVLRDQFADEKRIEWVIDTGNHHFVRVYDFGLHTTHGDELKYGGGVGGLAVPYQRRVYKSWDPIARRATGASTVYHVIGHFHQEGVYAGGRAMSNGSLIGFNEYALSVGAEDEPPRQLFCLFDSTRGRCQTTSVWVDGEQKAKRVAA